MTPTTNFFNLLRLFEGLKLTAYRDSAGIATIGIGTTHYPNGQAVKMGDKCTEDQAYQWAEQDSLQRAATLTELLNGFTVTQNQFEAMLSLAYNIGLHGFATSTILKIARGQKGDIRAAFQAWDKDHVDGKLVVNKGLLARRNKECDLYLS